MIRNTDGTERLYLSKGDQSIYIENCKIPQHHIDGLRFLYKQYKKKRSGVIINDTSGYGRNLQIVLFIKALRHLFDKPVLVLCHEGSEHDWVEQFQTWTDLCDDVVLETEKPHIKKLVLINTMSNLGAFTRREWSVLVMDGDRCSDQVLGLNFKAEYKIWVTPVNMRENLDKFSKIYKWLYPKAVFDKTQFVPDGSDPLDVVDKSVLLDAFMEDIVAKTETQDTAADLENDKKDESPPIRISRKNKDATGTKIKRSKRKIIDDEDDTPLSKSKRDNTHIQSQQIVAKRSSVSNEDYENAMSTKYETKDDFSIRKSIEEFDEDLLGDDKDSDTASSQVDLYYEPDAATEDNSDRLYEMDTLVFSNNTCNNQSGNDNDKVLEQNRESNINDADNNDDTPSDIEFEPINDTEMETTKNSSKYTTKDESKVTDNNDDTPSDIDFETTNDTQKITMNSTRNTSNNENFDISNEVVNNKSNIDNGDKHRESPVFIMNYEDEQSNEQSQLIIDEIKSDIDELEACKLSENVYKKSKSEDDEKNNKNVVASKELVISDELTPDIDNNIILNKVETKLTENEVINQSKSVTNEVTSVTKSKENCLEDKFKELEDKAMKKFKGSILDNLF